MSTKFKYSTLAEKMRHQIKSGVLDPDHKLPTESVLMKENGMSRQTVRQALACLESEGLIEKRRGSGSFIKLHPIMPSNGSANKTIAVITTYIGEYIFPNILRAVEETLTDNSFLTMIFATNNRVDNERKILGEILEQPTAGIIIEGTKTALPSPNIDIYRELELRGIPVVFIHASYPELSTAIKVVADDKNGGTIATEHLIASGHRKIAGIFKSDDHQGHLRYAGYTDALRKHNLSVVDDNVLWYATESKELISTLGLKVINGCTAVVCYNDEVAVQLLPLIRGSGLQIPDDISIMSFDNSTFSELATPKISSCSQNKRQIGVLAAEKIIGLINGRTQESSTLSWRVVEKDSVLNIHERN